MKQQLIFLVALWILASMSMWAKNTQDTYRDAMAITKDYPMSSFLLDIQVDEASYRGVASDFNEVPVEVAEEDDEKEEVYVVVEDMPEFPGGQQALFKYLSDSVKYPTTAQESGVQGRVICQFVVNKDGNIVDIEVVRSAGDASLDKEAIRLIKSMPKWKPGKQRGETVSVKYTVPVNFRL